MTGSARFLEPCVRPCPPVLFIVFNRPNVSRKVFGRIRGAHPARLFVAADGPRAECPGDVELCAETRKIVDAVDWPCEVSTLFQSANLGCRDGVSAATTWFFDHVEEGIILEDDCLPDPSFFPYCAELLERFRDDPRIMTIGGSNFQKKMVRASESYHFSKYQLCWGWAGWRRSWRFYHDALAQWPEWSKSRSFDRIFPRRREKKYWHRILNEQKAGNIDTWDYQWNLACWLQSGLCALPNVNLVQNIGFGGDGVHTGVYMSHLSVPAGDIGPIVHPAKVCVDRRADRFTDDYIFSGAAKRPWKASVRRFGWIMNAKLKDYLRQVFLKRT